MNDSNREQLSALSDGELARDALRFLLRRVDGDPALASAWTRYQLIGTTLRRDEQVLVDAGFSERVLSQLRDDTQIAVAASGGAGRERTPWMRWAGGGAIAASVAALALFATRGPQVDEALVTPAAPTLAQEVSVPAAELHAPVATLPAAGGDGANGSGLWDPRVQGYLMQHGQVAGQIGPSGFVPYVYFMATPSQVPPTANSGTESESVENAPR